MTARRASAGPPPAEPGRSPEAAAQAEAALEDALERVRELSLRLWAVRAAHRPVRALFGGARCATCGQSYPCLTVRAAGPPAERRSA